MVWVAPRVLPLGSLIVTLCGIGDWFAKSIVTLPAFALSEVCWKASCPLGSAETFRVDPPGAGAPPLGFPPLGFPPLGFPPLGFPPLGFPPPVAAVVVLHWTFEAGTSG